MFRTKYGLLIILLFAFVKLPAQLCQGSLGDPIVNITFGQGSNPGPPLAGTTTLQYKSGDCPDDGSYTITNSTSQCFYNTWHSLVADHTGDGSGYFMLINASYAPAEFYVDTVKGLCPNTTYEFAAWIMNIIVPSACSGNTIRPDLTFSIETTDGIVLKTYSTGSIDPSVSALWKQYGFFFTTPSATSNVVVRIKNNSAGGCGNDLALDDITFRPCGPLITSAFGDGGSNVKNLCSGSSANVTLTSNVSAGYSNPYYQWQQSSDNGVNWSNIPSANSTTFVINFPASTPVGDYLYRQTVSEAVNTNLASCKVASATLTVRVNDLPAISISGNNSVCQGSPITFSAAGADTYQWSGANGFASTGSSIVLNNAQFNNSGKYYVTGTTTAGCKNIDSIAVDVRPAPVASVSANTKTICKGDSAVLNSAGGGTYLWSPSVGLSSTVVANPVAKPDATTAYEVVVTNQYNCTDTAFVTVNVTQKPIVDAGENKTIVEGQSARLNGAIHGSNFSYIWSPAVSISDIRSLQPTVNPTNTQTYTLTATSNYGCGAGSDTVSVHVYKNVIIPNAFSPNGDGINDTWNITAITGYSNYTLAVYNRYGQTVFTTNNYDRPWNGTFNGNPLPVGTYYYLLDLKQPGVPTLKGFLVIVR